MNSAELAKSLINRVKHLQEFNIGMDVPDGFRFNGTVPFNIQISNGIINDKIHAVTVEEASTKLHNFIGTCK